MGTYMSLTWYSQSKPLVWVEILLKPSYALRYLGYYTDAGAYYYYNTEDGMNYDETFEFIRDYVERTKFPIKFRHGDYSFMTVHFPVSTIKSGNQFRWKSVWFMVLPTGNWFWTQRMGTQVRKFYFSWFNIFWNFNQPFESKILKYSLSTYITQCTHISAQ